LYLLGFIKMKQETQKKLQQLYVEEDLHSQVKNLATLKQQEIKTVVSNILRRGIKEDGFFKHCQEMYAANHKERKQYKDEPISFELYCQENILFLHDTFEGNAFL